MKEYDVVKVIVEKEQYTKEGVHKDMQGTIMDPRCIEDSWLVIFDGEFLQEPTTGVWYTTDIECVIKEKDLEVVHESKV